jgi:hypothetical protein
MHAGEGGGEAFVITSEAAATCSPSKTALDDPALG